MVGRTKHFNQIQIILLLVVWYQEVCHQRYDYCLHDSRFLICWRLIFNKNNSKCCINFLQQCKIFWHWIDLILIWFWFLLIGYIQLLMLVVLCWCHISCMHQKIHCTCELYYSHGLLIFIRLQAKEVVLLI